MRRIRTGSQSVSYGNSARRPCRGRCLPANRRESDGIRKSGAGRNGARVVVPNRIEQARMLKRTDTRRNRLNRPAWEVAEANRSLSPEGSAAAVSSETAAVVNQALNSLPENYRAVVERRIQQNKTFAEIAEELNKPIGTILTWMRRALAQLRDNKTLEDL